MHFDIMPLIGKQLKEYKLSYEIVSDYYLLITSRTTLNQDDVRRMLEELDIRNKEFISEKIIPELEHGYPFDIKVPDLQIDDIWLELSALGFECRRDYQNRTIFIDKF